MRVCARVFCGCVVGGNVWYVYVWCVLILWYVMCSMLCVVCYVIVVCEKRVSQGMRATKLVTIKCPTEHLNFFNHATWLAYSALRQVFIACTTLSESVLSHSSED